MLYSEVAKQFRLREGRLERYYQIQDEWRVVEFAKDYKKEYHSVQLGSKSASAHRVIACLNSKRDLPDSRRVYHIDGNSHNNGLSNISLDGTGNRTYVYKSPNRNKSGSYTASVCLSYKDRRGTFDVGLGSYNNVKHHKAITMAVRKRYITPLRNPFRTLFEAGFKDEARKLVQDYARTLEGCTLR